MPAPAGSGDRFLPASDPFAALLRHVADARVDAAAATRARLRNLGTQAGEQGAFSGVLADLAERGTAVVVVLASGREHRGRIAALGEDHLALAGAAHRSTLIATQAVALVRALRAPRVTGDRRVASDRVLADVLRDLAPDRPNVRVSTTHSDVRGVLCAVGQDVLTIRVPTGAGDHLSFDNPRAGHDQAFAYVALGAVTTVELD